MLLLSLFVVSLNSALVYAVFYAVSISWMNDVSEITIDGSQGEGGGQVLRSSLTLSLVTGRPFRMENIRARRPKPGLLRQHLTAVRAATDVGQASVDGAEQGSRQLAFTPGKIRPGEYWFAVGTAGSATLVLQTVLPALITADGPSKLTLEGGTHNPWAPPFDFLQKTFLPIINRMGPNVEATLQRPGFYPAGGGVFTVSVQPRPELRRVDLLKRGKIIGRRARAIVSQLPLHVAEREIDVIKRRMSLSNDALSAETVEAAGPGNCVMIEIQSEQLTEIFTAFGRQGVPAEKVAAAVVREAQRYLAAGASMGGVAVGGSLADQLLIPMALAGGGQFTTLAPSGHMTTNVDVLRRFLDVEVHSEEASKDARQITVASSTGPS